MKKTADIANVRFGSLIAISKISVSGQAKWLCACDCGKKTEVFATNLLRGKTKSCSCRGADYLIGERRGKLLVIAFAGTKNNKNQWLCRCDCGVEKIMSGLSLRKNRAASCGCSRRDNSIIGKRFGKLTVLDYAYTQSKNAYWLCQCDCGNKKDICGVHLKVGTATSCGCATLVSQTKLHKIICELFNNKNVIIKINYTPNILYCAQNKSRQQIDIAILNDNNDIVLAIEYDGRQHFEPVGFGSKNEEHILQKFNKQQNSDKRKNEILQSHNIPLIRIPYSEKLTKENIISIFKQHNIEI